MTECIVAEENIAKSSYEFHFTPQESPTFQLPGGIEVVIYKSKDTNIPLNPDSLCAIENILTTGLPGSLMYLNYPCFKCAERVFIRAAESQENGEV
jgi:hypothetical protein